MWVFDPMGLGAEVINGIQLGTQLSLLFWLVSGGLVFLIRVISWQIDSLLLSFIAKIYTYFVDLLEGTMFNTEVVNAVMRNIYIFIGVIIFFRLMMVLIKYIVNPELVSDGKVGANQLVKRVIIGLAGIIMVPTIFSFATKFQAAILEDQVIQRVIIPEDILESVKEKEENAGGYIGSYVLSGFVSPSSVATGLTNSEFKVALSKGDLSTIDVNRGAGFVGTFKGNSNTNYEYNYFFFLSTFVLGYVLFLMAKYCLDIAIRFFKLFLYQLIAPFAMIEYMINGSQDGVFKNWKNAVLSSYFMVFIRVFSIWFVIFVMTLMSGDLSGNKYTNNSLLHNPDYLLRAIIMIALLAFMMDLPKIVGQVFGLDLEQESSATGLLNSIKGGIGKIAGAGLAMGGAFAGGIVGSAKGLAGSALNKSGIGEKIGNKRADSLMNKSKQSGLDPNKQKALLDRAKQAESAGKSFGLGLGDMKTANDSLKASRKGMMKAAMGVSQYTNAAYGGYTSVGESASAKQKQREEQEHQTAREVQEDQFRNDVRRGFSTISNDDLAKQTRNSMPKDATFNEVLNATAESKTLETAQVNGFVTTSGTTATIDGAKANIQAEVEGHLNSGMSVDAVANVVSADMGSKLGVSDQTVRQIVQTEYSNGQTSGASPVTVSQNIVNKVYDAAVDISKQEVAPSVRKEYGNRTMTNVEATGDRIVDSVNTQGTQVSNRVDEVVNRVENVDRNVRQTNTTLNTVNTNINKTNTTVDKVRRSIDINTNITRNAATTINNTIKREEGKTRRTIERK